MWGMKNAATYTNPWHAKGYGPVLFETTARPTSYRGYLIYQRIAGHVWDIVRDGACVTQMAGPNGARRAVDQLIGTRV